MEIKKWLNILFIKDWDYILISERHVKLIVVAESDKKNKSEFIFKSIVIQLWSKSK